MAGKQQPGNNLWAGWDLGESGYKDQMDSNLRFLSAAVQLVLDQSTGALPASPTNGMLVATTGSPAIQARIDGAWVTVATAQKGWLGFDKARDSKVEFNGTEWVLLTTGGGGGGGLPDAPVDGKLYGRQDAEWTEVPAGTGGGIAEAPDDGKLYGRQNKAWLEVPAGGGGAELMPWGGARIAPTATQNYPSGAGTLRFASADYDTDGLWSPEYPNRLTVPSGVTRVRLYGCVKVDSSDTIPSGNTFGFTMNGDANFQGNGGAVLDTDGYNNPQDNLVSDAIEVTEGDYFELRYSANQSFSLAADRGRTWFAIEILERTQSNATLGNLLDVEAPTPTAGQSLVFDPVSGKWKPGVPVVNVNQAAGLNKPFRGALVKLSDDVVVSSTPNLIGWHDVEYDTDSFWSAGEPSRITIPAGIKKVRLSTTVQAQGTTSDTESFMMSIAKAGSTLFVGNGWGANRSGYNDSAFTAHTAVIEVSQGDFFEVRFNKSASGDVTLLSTTCSFSIEVVETEDPLP